MFDFYEIDCKDAGLNLGLETIECENFQTTKTKFYEKSNSTTFSSYGLAVPNAPPDHFVIGVGPYLSLLCSSPKGCDGEGYG